MITRCSMMKTQNFGNICLFNLNQRYAGFYEKTLQEGLMDPEFLTDTQASWTAKMTQNDKAFCYI